MQTWWMDDAVLSRPRYDAYSMSSVFLDAFSQRSVDIFRIHGGGMVYWRSNAEGPPWRRRLSPDRFNDEPGRESSGLTS